MKGVSISSSSLSRLVCAFHPRTVAMCAGLAAALLVSGCNPEIHTRGNLVKEKELEQIKVGSSTKADVSGLFGTPSTTSMFDGGETWMYIGSKTVQKSWHALEELDRKVVAISFDKNGTVSDMKVLGKDDGTKITMVERQTPTAGHSLSLMEQLLGNIGRFNSTGGPNEVKNLERGM